MIPELGRHSVIKVAMNRTIKYLPTFDTWFSTAQYPFRMPTQIQMAIVNEKLGLNAVSKSIILRIIFKKMKNMYLMAHNMDF